MPEPVEISGADDRADAAPTAAADEVLLRATAFAQRALLEVTPPETVGSLIGHVVDDEHVVTLHFAADLTGYPGWYWCVTLARVDDGEPTVLETELMPGEKALLAPDWVPWSERMADYRAAQEATRQAAADAGADGADDGAAELDDDDTAELDDDDDFDDDDDLDVDDLDDDDEPDDDEPDDDEPDDDDDRVDEVGDAVTDQRDD